MRKGYWGNTQKTIKAFRPLQPISTEGVLLLHYDQTEMGTINMQLNTGLNPKTRSCLRTGRKQTLPRLQKGQEGRPKNYRPVSLTSIPGKQLILEATPKHAEDKRVIRRSQHGFTKGKSCWTDGGRAVDVVYLTSARLLTLSPMICP